MYLYTAGTKIYKGSLERTLPSAKIADDCVTKFTYLMGARNLFLQLQAKLHLNQNTSKLVRLICMYTLQVVMCTQKRCNYSEHVACRLL